MIKKKFKIKHVFMNQKPTMNEKNTNTNKFVTKYELKFYNLIYSIF